MKSICVVSLLVLISARSDLACGTEPVAELGFAIAQKYCYGCHGVDFNGDASLNFGDPQSLVENGYVLPGSPVETSRVWQRVKSGEMPPPDADQPTAQEVEILRRWIAAGVPEPARDSRPFKAEAVVIKDILSDVRQLPVGDVPHYRYFTLHHLSNNPKVSAFDMRLYRAALSKAINSLTYANEIVVPEPIDEEETVFRIDLRDLGWDELLWAEVLRRYPYGLLFDSEDALRLYKLTESNLPYVRGDWFAVTATRPPLYHLFLDIPESDAELKKRLQVDVAADFDSNRLRRAGFDESGVSTGPRVLNRYTRTNGNYLWESHDFEPGRPRSSLYRFPLGPRSASNKFDQWAYEHDGGELIASLPNGLQLYMLVDAQGVRIDRGPIRIVRDLKAISNTPEVVNGISCMHCHQHGMIGFTDTVRRSLAVRGTPRKKALALYAAPTEMEEWVQRDSTRFLESLERAIGSFIRASDEDKPIEQFAEPIGAIAKLYQRDLTLEDAAVEFGFEKVEAMRRLIETNDLLLVNGLGPLANGRRVNRASLDRQRPGLSPYQEIAFALNLGEPILFFGGTE